MLTEVFAGFGG
jgi:hypothetical protein